MTHLDCGQKEYCSLHNSDAELNFCNAKGGDCRLKDTPIEELPLLAVVKKSVTQQERNLRLKR